MYILFKMYYIHHCENFLLPFEMHNSWFIIDRDNLFSFKKMLISIPTGSGPIYHLNQDKIKKLKYIS